MRVVLESAGALRGCLALPEGKGLAIAADASVEGQEVSVRLRPPLPSSALPWSILNYVFHSREKVLLADAAGPGPFAADEYVAKQPAKSVLCLPILRQAELIGVLYVENDLVTAAFSADRLAVLEMLAAQVAISMENALLLAKEQAARAAAEAAERRSAFVAHESDTARHHRAQARRAHRVRGRAGDTLVGFPAPVDRGAEAPVRPDERTRREPARERARFRPAS